MTYSHGFQHFWKGSVVHWFQRYQYISCWACKKPVHDVLCQSCGKVQPAVRDKNYFKVLGQEEKFSLNTVDLQTRFIELQRILHPDRFANCSEEEKSYSADQSAMVNEAYQVLLKPIQRATYLLKVNGVTLDEVKLPQKFLIEMMDLNEQVDTVTDKVKKTLLENIINIQEAAMADLQKSFAEGNNVEASKILAKIKYLDNLINRLK
ncbi:iron-sulfur cluster co-chaperone protein HscB, mitochondrial-like [Varroa jacobsoni]|uniref:iron-sulfur cluster co-chaperone protein HscB, mitochondrial-like n=1 Tax=Varroa jacobsoni TaxID=62625 RepID=UPI000BF609C7|nr:iron-sulfur cluster co-chaperone protein HscB, mitochondrial-like [Varroa jacobsoni]